MSADRWSKCPKCLAKHEKVLEVAREALKQAYGKVPVEEYLKMKENVDKPKEFEETLREDYEFYLDAGYLNVSYHCGCETCGFGFCHKEKVKLPLL